jgi:hypothetical protein
MGNMVMTSESYHGAFEDLHTKQSQASQTVPRFLTLADVELKDRETLSPNAFSFSRQSNLSLHIHSETHRLGIVIILISLWIWAVGGENDG